MPKMTKLSVTLPTDRLLLARNAGLYRPDEGPSAFLARLLDEALARRDAEAWAKQPTSPSEEAAGNALVHAGLAEVADASSGATRPQPRRRAAG
jgi:hypothetical protein